MFTKKSYPFINPIIVSKDKGVIDGQYRFNVCKQMKAPIEYIQIDYTKDELHSSEAIKEIRKIINQGGIELWNRLLVKH